MDCYFQPTVRSSPSVASMSAPSHPHELGTVAPPSSSQAPLVDNDFLLAMQIQQRLNSDAPPQAPSREEWKDGSVTPTVQSYATSSPSGLSREHGALLYQSDVHIVDEEEDRRTALALQSQEEEAWKQTQDVVPVALSDRDLAYHRRQEEEYYRKHQAAKRQQSSGASTKKDSNCVIS